MYVWTLEHDRVYASSVVKPCLWTVCRAKLDGNEELSKFTQDLEAATLATIEAGEH